MRYGKEVSQRILQVARVIQIVFLIAVFVLLAASMMLIANTIRLSIFSRRREIEVMKLVGATNWYVRGPFMLEGVLTGLAGSFAAVMLLFVGRRSPSRRSSATSRTTPTSRPGVHLDGSILVLVGLAIGALGSGLTLRRFLRV